MVFDTDMTTDPQHDDADWESPAVSLREAAQLLQLTESEVLMRVFHGSLPSLVDGDGERRVPVTALAATIEADEPVPAEVTALATRLGALTTELSEARGRIEALERLRHGAQALAALTTELGEARARIEALERVPQPPAQPQAALATELGEACNRIEALERLPQAKAQPQAALTTELRALHARIAALEARDRYPRPNWLRHLEACCRWLNLNA